MIYDNQKSREVCGKKCYTELTSGSNNNIALKLNIFYVVSYIIFYIVNYNSKNTIKIGVVEMDYSILILSVCTYVENRVKSEINPIDLENAVGYSYSHVRKAFKENMQISIGRYILLRKLNYAAFDLIHTDHSLLSIASEYGFEQYDAFTRAFKREIGLLPREFRRQRLRAGRRLIASGVYAPAILELPSPLPTKSEVVMKQIEKDSCILLGIPKVEYKWEECTPFPSCLKSCLNYMGQDINYGYLMAASGAAFRLRFNKKFWDGGNVDIVYIYEDGTEAFKRSFQAAGRNYKFLMRKDSNKQGFIDFIKEEIDQGRPVIALGVIGPPEACIITGYQENGEILLGWNFFQHRSEYNNGVSFHETGYFMFDKWWENTCTSMLMSIGETESAMINDKSILQNAIDIENRTSIVWKDDAFGSEIACGQEAYEIWSKWTADDKQFDKNITLPLLTERFMCQIDAQTMTGEGRFYAAEYLKSVGKRHQNVRDLCLEAAEYFYKVSSIGSRKMNEVLGRHENQELLLRHYAKPETRKELVKLIDEAAKNEAKAMEIIERIIENLSE